MKIITAAEMREVDRLTSERFGVPSLTLMENAGTAVARVAMQQFRRARSFGVICGKGNNGGDGFVAARKLHEAGHDVRVLLLADPGEVKGDAAAMLARMPLKPVVARTDEDVKGAHAVFECDVLLDAVLGTGFRPPVTGLAAAAIAAINAAARPVVAVDIPSGQDADAHTVSAGSARADVVVTFTAPRPAHVFAPLTAGPTFVAPIGSPAEAVTSGLGLDLITPPDIARVAAPRARDAHKGSFGHVLVVGGSIGKAGAAALAGMAALRSGAGVTTVATAESVLAQVAGFEPSLMTEPLPDNESGTIAQANRRFDAVAEGKTVIALGPGLSRHRDAVTFARHVVSKAEAPVVVDADGLNAFEGAVELLDGRRRPLVLTPHPGEMARLARVSTREINADRITAVRRLARESGCIVVLKGWRSVIALPGGEVWVNPTGNPGIATGRSGDVLTGLVAGLVAQHPNDLPLAVCAAVYLHGLAGDLAREEMGEASLIASDLLGYIGAAFAELRERAQASFVTF